MDQICKTCKKSSCITDGGQKAYSDRECSYWKKMKREKLNSLYERHPEKLCKGCKRNNCTREDGTTAERETECWFWKQRKVEKINKVIGVREDLDLGFG
jgi:hypothetical protein